MSLLIVRILRVIAQTTEIWFLVWALVSEVRKLRSGVLLSNLNRVLDHGSNMIRISNWVSLSSIRGLTIFGFGPWVRGICLWFTRLSPQQTRKSSLPPSLQRQVEHIFPVHRCDIYRCTYFGWPTTWVGKGMGIGVAKWSQIQLWIWGCFFALKTFALLGQCLEFRV